MFTDTRAALTPPEKPDGRVDHDTNSKSFPGFQVWTITVTHQVTAVCRGGLGLANVPDRVCGVTPGITHSPEGAGTFATRGAATRPEGTAALESQELHCSPSFLNLRIADEGLGAYPSANLQGRFTCCRFTGEIRHFPQPVSGQAGRTYGVTGHTDVLGSACLARRSLPRLGGLFLPRCPAESVRPGVSRDPSPPLGTARDQRNRGREQSHAGEGAGRD